MEKLHGRITEQSVEIEGGESLASGKAVIRYEGIIFFSPLDLSIKDISKVDGQFSMIMKNNNEAYLISDKLGTKTIYYSINKKSNDIFFGTSLKELSNQVDKEVDSYAVSDYLTFRTSMGNRTFFKNIKQVPPGCCLEVFNQEYDIKTYWKIPFPKVKIRIPISRAICRFENLLRKTIQKNIGSNKKVALLLSGGIDSTLLAAALSEMNVDFVAYTAHFSGNEYDELEFAEKVTNYLGVDHKIIDCTQEKYFNWLEELTKIKAAPVGQVNEPIIYGILKGVKEDPVFFGEGADELFGGYTRIFASAFEYERDIEEDSVDARYNHIARRYGYFSVEEKKALLKLATDSLEIIKEEITTDEDFFNNIARIFLHYHDLALIQRVRAACEATAHNFRIPYADPNMIEFAFSLPRKYKMYWKNNESRQTFVSKKLKAEEISEVLLQSKMLLRKSFNGFIERVLPERPKMGFPVPLKTWFMENPSRYKLSLLKPNHDYVLYQLLKREGILNSINAQNLNDWSTKLFMLLSLSLWLSFCTDS